MALAEPAGVVDVSGEVAATLADLVEGPVTIETLKHKPGRRRTLRVRGQSVSVIAKIYASERAPDVAAKLETLAIGPTEPRLPRVLHLDEAAHLLVLSDVPGDPLSEAVARDDREAARRTGAALAIWHAAWRDRPVAAFRPHTPTRELAILEQRRARASRHVAEGVGSVLATLDVTWDCPTIVHRDLYEEQVLVADRIGLIDLDDAALGPPELDVGNLLAHLELLGRRRHLDVGAARDALLAGYATMGPPLDGTLVETCRVLSLLRLACLNDDPALVPTVPATGHRP